VERLPASMMVGSVPNSQRVLYRFQRSIESGDRILVGVNKYETQEDQTFVPFAINPESEREQVSAVKGIRASRDG